MPPISYQLWIIAYRRISLHVISKTLCHHYNPLETSEGHISTPAHSLVSNLFLTTDYLYSFPPNGPLVNGKELNAATFFCEAEERSELGVLGYPERLASLSVDFPRCFGFAIANQARAIAR
jgi:hypothetical protein